MLLTNLSQANSADPKKVFRIPMEAPDDGFNMVKSVNYYSGLISETIFETLLTYDYLAEPVKLIPLTAESMPKISDNGKTFVFHIKKGIYFTPDPIFKGKRRELTAKDYAYSIKRFLDPANRSPSQNFVNGKIVGLNELAEAAKKSGKFDYDAPVAGLTTPDRYTLVIKLNYTDYNFLYAITYSSFGAVAREVVEGYPETLSHHPVGTGPYMLKSYTPRSEIILVANPNWRGFIWDFKSTGTAWDDQLVKEMKGKKMPQVGRVEISILEEEQSRWLAFRDGQFDVDYMPAIAASSALDGAQLKLELREQGLKMYRAYEPDITYAAFNFRDPVLGGNSLEKNALRRAIIMAYNLQDDIAVLRMGQAEQAQMLVARGLIGHDPNYRNSTGYNIPLANKLLDYFGYKRGADGYRTFPNGQPLLVQFPTTETSSAVTMSEIWKRGLKKIGLHSAFPVNNFADNIKAANQCKLMVFSGAWIADYPDGENFYQLFYGPNALRGNYGCYQSAAYDALYDKVVSLPPGSERNALYQQMNRQMEADSAMVLQTTRIRSWLIQPEVLGYKRHSIMHANFQYIDMARNNKRDTKK
ncbi:MAG: hbpA [Solimicrobium sp.]|jgi:ABC-type transport system substrate-binding protein|nr:hbpA [Solimicrobium sp.]